MTDVVTSKFDLMVAFMTRKPVCVRIDGQLVRGVINELIHEDGSGRSFIATVTTGTTNVVGYIGRFN